jgi:hypothetical protein
MNLPSSTEDAANSPSNQLKILKNFTQDYNVMPKTPAANHPSQELRRSRSFTQYGGLKILKLQNGCEIEVSKGDKGLKIVRIRTPLTNLKRM